MSSPSHCQPDHFYEPRMCCSSVLFENLKNNLHLYTYHLWRYFAINTPCNLCIKAFFPSALYFLSLIHFLFLFVFIIVKYLLKTCIVFDFLYSWIWKFSVRFDFSKFLDFAFLLENILTFCVFSILTPRRVAVLLVFLALSVFWPFCVDFLNRIFLCLFMLPLSSSFYILIPLLPLTNYIFFSTYLAPFPPD